MEGSGKADQRAPDEVARLTQEVQALRARLEALEVAQYRGQSGNESGHAPQSRRDVLKLAGAAAAGAAGSILLGSVPAAAVNGQPVLLGNATTNDASTTTDIFATTGTVPAPLFQATGQNVPANTTVAPTGSTTDPMSQSIPLIGGIGAGGTLPISPSSHLPDYPGYAPIQGVGGIATILGGVVSEGLNGWGQGATGIGVTGESDTGYGLIGASGGIDVAAYGHGRLMQLPLFHSSLAASPAGPPIYFPNDFEQVRDGNGVLYISVQGGGWVPVQAGGLNVGFFTAVSNQQYRLTGSDGATWVDMDLAKLAFSITPLFNCYAIFTANADLWTAVANFNQDIGVFVSGGAYGAGQVVGWKESGGRSGTFSPNAAFLETVAPLTRLTTYNVKLQWKTNQASNSGVTIFAGAGLGPTYSPTRLSAQLIVNP